jgi:RNA polymerase sigma factor (sigma-70 family)
LNKLTALETIVFGCCQEIRQYQKEFYMRYFGLATSITGRYCNNYTDAEAIANDGFLKIFKQIKTFEPKHHNYEAALVSWIKKIFVNTAIDYYRKNKKQQLITHEIDEIDHNVYISPYETAIDQLGYQQIIELVQKLSPSYRTVFNLFVIDGFKHEEIADQLGITEGASKSNLAKARQKLQHMLGTINSIPDEQRNAV